MACGVGCAAFFASSAVRNCETVISASLTRATTCDWSPLSLPEHAHKLAQTVVHSHDHADDDHAPPAPAAYLMAEGLDPAQTYESADSEADQLDLLREGMARLDDRSRDIIKRRWLEPDSKVTLQELADEYGVSAERIRQIEANALKKMKALFAA